MNTPHAFESLVQAGIQLLKSHQIYQDFMEGTLRRCKTFPDLMAKEMIKLHNNGLLNHEYILALQNHESLLKNLSDAIIALADAKVLNSENLAMVLADNYIPDKKACAIIILAHHECLNDRNRKALSSYKRNPEILAKVLVLLKEVLFTKEEFQMLLNYHGDMYLLHDAFTILSNNHMMPQCYLLVLKSHRNPMELAQAFILLQKFDLEFKKYHPLLIEHINPHQMARAMIALHQEKMLTPEHLQLLDSSKDLPGTIKKILQPHLLKKASFRGFTWGLFTGSATGILMWGFTTTYFLQITTMLYLAHPAITLAILALSCALILSLACFFMQHKTEHRLNF
ncbi:MAG: hypothetical protein QG556_462 [Pseudomonadota bacterium]|nr:hypothetical protein [Pseudomonadota bacterium]